MEELLIKIQEAKEKSEKCSKLFEDFESNLISSFEKSLSEIIKISDNKHDISAIFICYVTELLLKKSVDFTKKFTEKPEGINLPDGFVNRLQELNTQLNQQLTILEYESN